jgi:DNA-binding SARP family transcriptional activator/tetratricopeptide (TPR) repeat protein
VTAAAAGSGHLRIEVLGPFAVSVDGRPVALTAGRLRAMLATLALSAGEPVTSDRLAAAVWGDDLPRDTRGAVQVYVARLRRALGPEAIRTVPNGYVLAATPDQVDAVRFVRLLDAADLAADPEAERALLVEALALWRGEPFEGGRWAWLDGVEAQRLVDRRLVALERRVDLDLSLGRAGDLVAELTGLTARYPLRERFWGQLMTALYRTGQQAEALEVYQRLRRLLADELGIEPSAAVQEVHRRILSGGAAPEPPAGHRWASKPAPQQLPAGPAYFTGRSGSLARLDALLPEDDDAAPTTVVISAIAGAAGVGKTALAVHWARRMADRFPDGNLYVNLHGFDPSGPPIRPGDTIRGFLEALGMSPHRIPADPQAQVGLYRTLLAGKRMLVLVDNARDADQVRPLLPGTPGCVVVVTSRNQLTGLVAHDGAHLVNLDVLTRDEALRLLEVRLGPERVAAERRAAKEIVERCGRLPLALTVAAARAVAHPAFPLAALAGELRDAQGRLDTLSGADALTDLRAAFAVSYRTLKPDAARLFRLLGLHPGPDTSAAAAASLAGLPLAQVQASLAELAGIHMIVEQEPGRYSFHDLLRAYAAELAATQESGDQRRAAIRRVLDHYLHTAHAAAHQLNPHRDHPVTPIDPAPGVAPEQVGDRGPAPLAWFTTEHAVLVACVGLAVDTGLDTHVWQLAWTLSGYLARSGRWQDWVATQYAALGAVERLGDRSAQAQTHRGLARAYQQLGRLDDARTHQRTALRLYAELDDGVGLGHTHLSLGQTYEMQDDSLAALDHAEQALRLFRGVDARTGEALALNAAGWCNARLGNHRQALTYCTAALRLQQQRGDRFGEAITLDSLGYAHHHLGNLQQAIDCYQSSLALRHDGGDRYGEARTLIRLGDTTFALGDTRAAGRAWKRAVSILDELDHPDADWAREKLQQLENPETVDADQPHGPAPSRGGFRQ